MNRKDFLTKLIGAVPVALAIPVIESEKAEGFGWMTDPVKLSLKQRKAWKDRIENELKGLFFSVDVRVNVVATYLEKEGRFHVAISRDSYIRDQRCSYFYEAYNPYA